MLANVVITRDSVGNMKPDKAKSANTIDGIVAAMMALGIASRDLQQAGTMYSDWSFDEDF
jgi:phage terminase large subunit-like protein